jgi:hypothetical protein
MGQLVLLLGGRCWTNPLNFVHPLRFLLQTSIYVNVWKLCRASGIYEQLFNFWAVGVINMLYCEGRTWWVHWRRQQWLLILLKEGCETVLELHDLLKLLRQSLCIKKSQYNLYVGCTSLYVGLKVWCEVHVDMECFAILKPFWWGGGQGVR